MIAIGDFAFHPAARPSNAITDLMLCVMHLAFVVKLMKLKPATAKGCELRMFAVSYAAVACIWQAMGARTHVYDPIATEMSFSYFLHLAFGAGAPTLYGCAISSEILSRHAARRWQLAYSLLWLCYMMLAVSNVDLADHFSLPRTQELTFSAGVVNWMPVDLIPWLPRAVADSGGAGNAITLLWDGRGYASVPLEHAFNPDRIYADRFDLVAPFPCWKPECTPFLFNVFGLGLNSIFLVKSLSGYLAAAYQQVDSTPGRKHNLLLWLLAHCVTMVGIALMPAVMLFGGVAGSIDFMHIWLSPAMYWQLLALEGSVRGSFKDESKKAA